MFEGVPHGHELHGRLDIMDPHDMDLLVHGVGDTGQGASQPFVRRDIENPSNERLPGRPDDDRPSQRHEFIQMLEEEEVVREGLAKAKPWIDENVV